MKENKTIKHKIVFLDLDDFSESNNRLDWLWMLKNEFPNFKVNLFTIPNDCSIDFLNYVGMIDWIQLCTHGYYHKNDEEVSLRFLQNRSILHQTEHFAPVYRAPFWQLSNTMYERLKKLNYKIMLHPDDLREGIKYNWNIKDSPPPLDILYGHGHIQDYPIGPNGNGIVQAFENIMKLPKDTEFRFL